MTLFRKLINKLLKNIELNGEVLDLGGGKDAGYIKLFKGDFRITTADIDLKRKPDIVFDFETAPFPLVNNKYDNVLLINVLEHIYNFKELFQESFRILKLNGNIIIVVPFLHQIHPSPKDYFRYTKECLERILLESGFSEIEISEIGFGAFSAIYNLTQRFFPSFLCFFLEKTSVFIDKFLAHIGKIFSRKYDGKEYPLGYLIKARKIA